MTDQQTPTSKAWFMTVLYMLFMLINFIDKVGVGLVAVPMMRELNLTPTEFGVIAASFFWLFAISGVLGGFLANRVSTRWLLLIMAVVWSLAQLPILVSSSVVFIVISRVALGIGEGPASPVIYHACYKWFPDYKRVVPNTVINMGSTLGLLIAGVAIPHITVSWGWQANFLVMAVIGAAWALMWLAFGAEGPLDAKPADGAAQDAGRIPYRTLLREPTVLATIFLTFTAFWAMALTLTWLPAYMQKGLGFDALKSGQLFGVVVLMGIPINLGMSWWSQRMQNRGSSTRTSRALLCSGSLLLSGLLFFALQFLPLPAFAKVILLGLASGLVPATYALCGAMLGSVSPDGQRGAMLAIGNSIASLAGVAAPVLMGRLIERSADAVLQGYERGFAVSGLLLVAGALVGLIWAQPEQAMARLKAQAAT